MNRIILRLLLSTSMLLISNGCAILQPRSKEIAVVEKYHSGRTKAEYSYRLDRQGKKVIQGEVKQYPFPGRDWPERPNRTYFGPYPYNDPKLIDVVETRADGSTKCTYHYFPDREGNQLLQGEMREYPDPGNLHVVIITTYDHGRVVQGPSTFITT